MIHRRNLEFFGAPHVVMHFMPEVGDNVRVTGDIGMYAQTLLLSLTAPGLGGIPQRLFCRNHPQRTACGPRVEITVRYLSGLTH